MLNYKKPAFWIIIGAVVICIVVAVCFLTNPPYTDDDPPTGEVFTEYEGVYLAVNAITVNVDGHGTFDLVMYNNTKNQVTYGSAYIQRKDGDRWVSFALDTLNSAYSGFLLNPDSAEHLLYTTMKLDVSAGGTYRLVIPFSVDDGKGDESYNVWFEFNAEDLPITENNGRYTEYTGVYLRTDTININTDGHYVFKLVMYNNTDKQVTYGLNYFIQRKDGDEWVSVATEDLIFASVAYRLNPGRAEVLTYTSEKFDLSEPGTYRLVVPFSIDEGNGYKDYKTWIEFGAGDFPSISDLRQKYPQFFGLNTENGLTVRIVPTNTCYLFSTGSEDISVYRTGGASMVEMRMIVDTYNLDRGKISIDCFSVLSSFEANQKLLESIMKRFWSDSMPDETSPYCDVAIYDIDNDSVEEICILRDVNFSGLSGVVFSVQSVDNYTHEYSSTIAFFQKGTDGVISVEHGSRLYNITSEDGKIRLT